MRRNSREDFEFIIKIFEITEIYMKINIRIAVLGIYIDVVTVPLTNHRLQLCNCILINMLAKK